MSIDILPRLKTRESTKWIFWLRVSSGLKYAFAWAVNGRHRVVTNGVLFSAYSPVNGAFPPVNYRRQQRGTTFHEQSGVVVRKAQSAFRDDERALLSRTTR